MFQKNTGDIVGFYIVLVHSSTHRWWLAVCFFPPLVSYILKSKAAINHNSTHGPSFVWRTLGSSLYRSQNPDHLGSICATNMQNVFVPTLLNVKYSIHFRPIKIYNVFWAGYQFLILLWSILYHWCLFKVKIAGVFNSGIQSNI